VLLLILLLLLSLLLGPANGVEKFDPSTNENNIKLYFTASRRCATIGLRSGDNIWGDSTHSTTGPLCETMIIFYRPLWRSSYYHYHYYYYYYHHRYYVVFVVFFSFYLATNNINNAHKAGGVNKFRTGRAANFLLFCFARRKSISIRLHFC